MISELGDLADPSKFREPVELGGVSPDDALVWYRKLVEIRKVEELTADIVLSGEVYTPCHLSIGQEAVAVGVAHSLTADDFIYSNHRSHAHFLALGGPMDGLLAEVLCRDSGVSGGYGGSQHLTCEEVGFRGSVPIVGAIFLPEFSTSASVTRSDRGSTFEELRGPKSQTHGLVELNGAIEPAQVPGKRHE